MVDSNLRPISAACSLLMGAAQGKDDADRDVKQREWIWEFFLKNNSDGRLLVELMTALRFPDENFHLKRLLLLRSLSLQLSSGLFDELTLDIVKALGEISGHSECLRAGVDCSEQPIQLAEKWRVPEKENVDTRLSNLEATKVTVKRGLPESLVGRKSLRSRKEGRVQEEVPDKNQRGKFCPGRDPSPSEDGGCRSELSCLLRESLELQLAVMVELTVKHLRGVSVSRKAFEAALRRYWGDFITDSEEPVEERLDFVRARKEIRDDLWKVHSNLDFLDEITCKYNEERAKEMLASFLENAWAETQESFLEKVSSDVVNGVYKPLNPDVQWRNMGGVVAEDGVVATRTELLSEKPFVRSSRGKFSRSREKLQKTFGVLEINARREVEKEEGIAPENVRDSGENERSTEAVKTCKFRDILGPSLVQSRTTKESLQTTRSTSHGFGKKDSIGSGLKEVDTADTEVNECNQEQTGRSRSCDRKRYRQEDADEAEDGGHSDKHTICDRLAEDLRNAEKSSCSPNIRGNMDASHGNLRNCKCLCHGDREFSEEPCGREQSICTECANFECQKSEGAPVDIVDISSPSPEPLAQIQGCLSPPAWVASSLRTRKKLAPELIENRPAGRVEVDAGNARAEVSSGAENPVESSDPDSAERSRKEKNLQAQPDVVIPVSSPKIQETASVQHRFMQRNSTARTLEWEDDDDISENAPSPPGSKRVTTGQTSPLIASRGTLSQASLQRRKPRKWSTEETQLLKNEVLKYGKGRWKLILLNNLASFHGRTEVDLKDKWRNLERSEGLSVRDE